MRPSQCHIFAYGDEVKLTDTDTFLPYWLESSATNVRSNPGRSAQRLQSLLLYIGSPCWGEGAEGTAGP